MRPLQIDRDHHAGSIVTVMMAMLAAGAAPCIAGRQTAAMLMVALRLRRIVAVLVVGGGRRAARMAALVMVMMVALLFALDAHVGDHHFGAVAQAEAVATEVAAPAIANKTRVFLKNIYTNGLQNADGRLTSPDSRAIGSGCRVIGRGRWAPGPWSPCGAADCACCSSRRTRADSPRPGGNIWRWRREEMWIFRSDLLFLICFGLFLFFINPPGKVLERLDLFIFENASVNKS